MIPRPRILSVFSTFATGGPQMRFAAIANHFGNAWRHEVVAMDGKALRAACDRGESPVHMVSAWSCANGLVLGQLAVEEKSNEITALPELIRMLHLKGCIVTIDAMAGACHRSCSRW